MRNNNVTDNNNEKVVEMDPLAAVAYLARRGDPVVKDMTERELCKFLINAPSVFRFVFEDDSNNKTVAEMLDEVLIKSKLDKHKAKDSAFVVRIDALNGLDVCGDKRQEDAMRQFYINICEAGGRKLRYNLINNTDYSIELKKLYRIIESHFGVDNLNARLERFNIAFNDRNNKFMSDLRKTISTALCSDAYLVRDKSKKPMREGMVDEFNKELLDDVVTFEVLGTFVDENNKYIRTLDSTLISEGKVSDSLIGGSKLEKLGAKLNDVELLNNCDSNTNKAIVALALYYNIIDESDLANIDTFITWNKMSDLLSATLGEKKADISSSDAYKLLTKQRAAEMLYSGLNDAGAIMIDDIMSDRNKTFNDVFCEDISSMMFDIESLNKNVTLMDGLNMIFEYYKSTTKYNRENTEYLELESKGGDM